MRTAIFVYEPTLINILTHESNLALCGMDAEPVPLSVGDNPQKIAPGIYKIVASQDVVVTGDTSAFDLVVSNTKDNDPTPPPLRATQSFATLDAAVLQAFLTVVEAKVLASP
jgi:hypothetical protein